MGGLGWFFPTLAQADEFKLPDVGLPGRRVGAATRLRDTPPPSDEPDSGRTRGPLPELAPPPARLPLPSTPVPQLEPGEPQPDCLEGNPPSVIALIPQTNIGFVADQPLQFFWFVPTTRARQAKFILYHRRFPFRPFYQVQVNLNRKPGIMSLTVPERVMASLKSDKNYRWSFSIICEPRDRRQDITLEGWVRQVRLDPAFTQKLEQATPGDRIALLAQKGLWFDTLTELAELRCQRPDDPSLKARWLELMQSVQLNEISEQPFTFCP